MFRPKSSLKTGFYKKINFLPKFHQIRIEKIAWHVDSPGMSQYKSGILQRNKGNPRSPYLSSVSNIQD